MGGIHEHYHVHVICYPLVLLFWLKSIYQLYFLQRASIADPCTTLPITGYYIHAVVINRNGNSNERIYTSNRIDDNLGGTMGRFSVSYNDSFIQDLQPNAIYLFTVSTKNDVIEIEGTDTIPSCGM